MKAMEPSKRRNNSPTPGGDIPILLPAEAFILIYQLILFIIEISVIDFTILLISNTFFELGEVVEII